MSGKVRPCPRCNAELFTLKKIASIASEIKIDLSLAADEYLYEKRIKVCGECDALREQVMCAHCGCFILFRARPAKSYCPHPKGDRWNENF